MASGEITVTVERAIHDGLRDLAQKIFDLHGIKILEADIRWLDISQIGQTREVVDSIIVSSESIGTLERTVEFCKMGK
jgi:hypothetical protein